MRAVAIVGFKGSGKTTVAAALIRELKRRGYRVAALKHAHERLKRPPSDSTSLLEAGADEVLVLGSSEWERAGRGDLRLWEALAALRGYDYLVVEGFKNVFPGARIVVAKTLEEAKKLRGPLVIAYAGPIASDPRASEELGAPVVDAVKEPERLADIAERKSFEPPAGIDCGFCKYGSCIALAEAVARGEATPGECTVLSSPVRLRVGGVDVPLNPFVQRIVANVVLALVSSLKGVPEAPQRIEVVVSRSHGAST